MSMPDFAAPVILPSSSVPISRIPPSTFRQFAAEHWMAKVVSHTFDGVLLHLKA